MGRTGRLLIANHLDQSLWLLNLEQGAARSDHICYTLLWQVLDLTVCFYTPTSANCTKMLGQAHFAELNQHVLTFLHPILLCRGHILLSTGRVGPAHVLPNPHLSTLQNQVLNSNKVITIVTTLCSTIFP